MVDRSGELEPLSRPEAERWLALELKPLGIETGRLAETAKSMAKK